MTVECIALLTCIKYPREGYVKTRLAASIGSPNATLLYRKFVEICLDRYRQIDLFDCTIYFDPPEEEQAFREWLGPGYHYLPQSDGDLGQRMYHGIRNRLETYSKVIVLGTDSPDLPVEYVQSAVEQLHHHDVVIGPTEDGGYYLIGMTKPIPDLFQDIPWSTGQVWEATLDKLQRLESRYRILPTWYDIDTLQELKRLAESQDPRIRELIDSHPSIFASL